MHHIISPTAFTLVPWKNGLGSTTQLAINEGGSIQHFDWRVSMSKVIANGPFSSFPGYQRHLVLLSGSGIRLHYMSETVDKPIALCDDLITPLACVSFDGGLATRGELIDSEIVDLNIITRQAVLNSHVEILSQQGQLTSRVCEWVMAYAVEGDLNISGLDVDLNDNVSNKLINAIDNKTLNSIVVVPEKHLFQIYRPISELRFTAQKMILIMFTKANKSPL
ncbi:HutD family protein [Shewanella sp. SG41-4]|uniref:HutD/Ves family protein n=1 Tax=Shewanella sp. SG41-4 TaxID=2760976 RepID=UPI001600081C|nr:HutD family protein [Shewanella sp. SG41-4]MBB1439388.1 HutD family protein [Shewanella sp. SG41-4]